MVISATSEADDCQRHWQDMKRIATTIIAGEKFLPNPTPLCEWCPFCGGLCSLTPPSQHDDVDDWLDWMAD